MVRIKNDIITCSIYSSFEEIENLRENWDSFIESIDGEIFLSFDWCRIWWKYYGCNRKLKIFIIMKKNIIVGIMPLFFEHIWFGPLPLTVVKFVCSDFTLSQFTFPVNCNYSMDVTRVFLESLLKFKWNIASFGNFTSFLNDRDLLTKSYFSLNSLDLNVETYKVGVQTIFELNRSWEDYLSLLKKKDRQLILKNYRNIQKENLNFESSVATEENLHEFYSEFVLVHQTQWKHKKRGGHFGDWPKSIEFHNELAKFFIKNDKLKLLKVKMADDCFAYQYSYKFGNRYFEILMGRYFSSYFDNIDLGRLLFSEQVKQAIDQSISNIDSMQGYYDYKIRLGGKIFPLLRVRIIRSGLFNNIFLIFIDNFVKFIDIIYYKIWFTRVVPAIGFKNSNLWEYYIKIKNINKSN